MEKVIMVEFNELSPVLLHKWMGSGDLPNFKKLHDGAAVYTTVSDELEPSNMEPWIQWYSIHTGLPYSEHKVFHLTDGPRADHLDIWRHLYLNGKKVWNCSSMNAKQFSYTSSTYLPDPWCTSESAYPVELNKFHKFVSRQVREYSSTSNGSKREVIEFVTFMMAHGLSFSGLKSILSQLLGEFQNDGETRWQRVAVLDRLLFDVFTHYYKKTSPDFSTFFVNSTAHLQHSYWRHMDPDKFTVKPPPGEIEQYSDAILFGYKKMDALLGDIAQLAGKHTRLIFATALSQQPYLKYEHIGGHHFYRPKDIEKCLDDLNIVRTSVQSVMTHQFLLSFSTLEEQQSAKIKLQSLMFGGDQVFGFSDSEPLSLYFGCQLQRNLDVGGMVLSELESINDFRFGDQFYKIDALKSGGHHPDGCLWIQSDKPSVFAEKVSILDIFPTVSKMFGISTDGMRGRALTS